MHSLLTVDVGNTELKFGLFAAGKLAQHWRIEAWRAQKSNLPTLLLDALRKANTPYLGISYCSVVPEIEGALKKAFSQKVESQHILNINSRQQVSEQEGLSFPVDFSQYAAGQLGADRLANVCGAVSLYPNVALVVISFGTATTFDLVDEQGIYRGGAIAPGWQSFSQVLSEKTAQLPYVSFDDKAFKDLGIGLNTVSCIETGLGLGYRGLLLEILKVSQEKLYPQNGKIITTGGLGRSVSRVCGLEKELADYLPSLALLGLAKLYELNRSL